MLMAVFSLTCLNAQELRMPKYGFLDNWSISAAIGGNMTFGDLSQDIKPQTWGPEAWISLNKEFTPVIGTRIQLGWGKNNVCGFENWGGTKEFLQDMSLKPNRLDASLDFTINPINIFSSNYDRIFNPLVIVGLGYSHTFEANSEMNDYTPHLKKGNYLVPKVGLQLNFRVSDPVSLFVEGDFRVYSDKLDGIVNKAQYDGNLALTAGLTYRFKNHDGTRGFNYIPSYNQEDVDALNNEINNLREQLDKKPTEVIVHDTLVIRDERVINTSTPLTVRFSADSYEISEDQKANIENLALFLKDNPEMVVSVIGYADAETGTPEYNQDLSEKRAEAVVDVLVDKYGINPEQLNVSAEGDKVQQYETNSWNRAVLVIQ